MSDEFDLIEPEPFPFGTFDVESLEKGDYIDQEIVHKLIEQLLGKKVDPETSEYQLGQLRVRHQIESARAEIGRPIHLRSSKGSLYVLTDAEDVDHQKRREESMFRGLAITQKRRGEIDVNNLTTAQREKLRDHSARAGAMIQAMRHAAKKALPPPEDE